MKIAVIALLTALVIVSGLLCYELQVVKQYEKELAISEDYIASLSSINEQLGAELISLEAEISHWRFGYRDTRLQQFGSVGELESWLADDPVSDQEYIPTTYDCDDFAIDLSRDALADGYWIGLCVSSIHMFNFTIIGNEIYRIEAETDAVTFWGVLD